MRTARGPSFHATPNGNKGSAYSSLEVPALCSIFVYQKVSFCVCTEASVLIITGLGKITYSSVL